MYVNRISITYDFGAKNYDPLAGNIRLKYSENTSTEEVAILEENHYYPYGLTHKGYNSNHKVFTEDAGGNITLTPVTPLLGDSYKYGFNGVELNEGLGLNVYEMDVRQYDPAKVRWTVIDPVIHHSQSPYNAFDNNPIFWADPSGADSTEEWMERNGITDHDLTTIYQANDIGKEKDDIIFKNNSGKEIARIFTNSEENTIVNVNTDLSLPSRIEIDARTDEVADAVGINFEWSITVGGGAHGGTGFVYFMNEENLFNYDYKGGNVGLGEGFGIGVFASEFNDDLPSSLKSVSTFEGNYNGYEASYGFGGYSYSWSNRKNTSDQIYPGVGGTDNNPWTWKNRSLGGGAGVYQGSPKFQARYFGGESYDFTKINLN